MTNKLTEFASQAGAIRLILYVLAIIAIVFKPANDTMMSLEGLDFIPTLILPVIAPLLTTGFFLDMLMCKIYASEQPDDVKAKFKTISRVDLLLAVLLLVFWVPYMLSIN